MDYSASLSRAIASGAIWFGVSYGLSVATGANLQIMDTAVDAGIMAGSSIGADVVHSGLGWSPTGITSALATGGMYAGIQYAYRGDANFLVNGAAAAGNDMLVEMYYSMLTQ
jgi:hypothetical protein